MLKRILPLTLLASIAFLMAGCGGKPSGTKTADGFHIGIMTGTVSQGEEDFRAGEQVKARWPGRVNMVTYPDNFMNEQETTIAQFVGLSSDPEVKVIMVAQAVPGSVSAARKIREQRPDILIGFVQPHEDPAIINTACDIAIQPDQEARGRTIIETAKKMGAKVFVHYSFPRHMSQQLMASRRDIMAKTSKELGIEFHHVNALDPMGEGGLPAAQQFALEDVPRKIDQYGAATAFYCTNDGMQEPIIRAILEKKAGYFVEQDVPAPSAGYPAALGIQIPPDKAGDMPWLNEQIKAKIAERGMSGHFGSWKEPVDMVITRAMAALLVDAVDKKADYKDMATVQKYMEKEAGGPCLIRKYDQVGNQFLVVLDHITY